jgi:hypothetical protein
MAKRIERQHSERRYCDANLHLGIDRNDRRSNALANVSLLGGGGHGV